MFRVLFNASFRSCFSFIDIYWCLHEMIIWNNDGSFYLRFKKNKGAPPHSSTSFRLFCLSLFFFFLLSCDKKSLSPEEKCVYVSEVLDTLLITTRDVGGGVRREMNLISHSGLNCCKRIWV